MIEQFSKKYNLPNYRIDQFNNQYYKNLISSFDDLSTWPKDLINKLKKEVKFSSIKLIKTSPLDKSTIKFLFETEDGKKFESVLMQHSDGRNTICVSSMIGCPIGCVFCATGKMGYGRSLTKREIVDQVLYIARFLKKKDEKLTNIVFMGMGEPLLNLENVIASIKIFNDKDKIGLGSRRMTISTCGIIKGIEKLINLKYKGKLALSLHAPDQELRERLMPISKTDKLPELMKACDKFTEFTKRRITYEYILLDNINDQKKHARLLAKLLKNKLHHLNLIPYNKIPGVDFSTSSQKAIKNFTDILQENNINFTIRYKMGDDIEAACGQLAARSGINGQPTL